MTTKEAKSVIKSLRITPKNDEKIDILGINLPFFTEKMLEKEYFLQFFGEMDKKISDYQDKIYELKKLKRRMDPGLSKFLTKSLNNSSYPMNSILPNKFE